MSAMVLIYGSWIPFELQTEDMSRNSGTCLRLQGLSLWGCIEIDPPYINVAGGDLFK